jgi:hypothetical protein
MVRQGDKNSLAVGKSIEDVVLVCQVWIGCAISEMPQLDVEAGIRAIQAIGPGIQISKASSGSGPSSKS